MSEVHEYETEIGAFYVKVRQSRIDEFWSGDERVRRERGRLVVGTNPECNIYKDGGGVKIRGRIYRTGNTYARNVPPYQNGLGKSIEWDCNTYRSEYWNGRGASVGWDTPTRKRLEAAELEVLARFEAEHPDWVRSSRLLRLEHERDSAMVKAAGLQAEANEASAKAAALLLEIEALGGAS